ncbi:MAG: hypothetical protein IPM24_23375 [Bryobacterales bacterium]|nr:hypothetical protein [Bryobacterales bacterium]
MWRWSNIPLALWLSAAAAGQTSDPGQAIRIDLAPDAPVALVSADLGESRTSARGGAIVIDLRLALTLKNTSASRIRGVTMLVSAQEVTPGGRGSVAAPCLDIAPGDVFPLRIDLRLLRPLQGAAAGPLVRVGLDGVLFEDLSFYGPNRLDSRRTLTAWEMEARRDRLYFQSVLTAGGPDGLREEVLRALARQRSRPRLDVEVARRAPAVGAAASATAARQVRFAFAQFDGAPVVPVDGSAEVGAGEIRSPRISVRNDSREPVRYYELGWIVRDAQGQEYAMASVPAPRQSLAPGASATAAPDTALRFRDSVQVAGMTGFVSQVEFADGRVWVPSRNHLAQAQLLHAAPPSAEEQRLLDLYRKKGLPALIEELRKLVP